MVASCFCPKLLTEDSLYNSMRLFVLIIADTILLVNMLYSAQLASLWCCEACVEVFLMGHSIRSRMKN
jgi:hypothetical protein